jgi:hypothetical protein
MPTHLNRGSSTLRQAQLLTARKIKNVVRDKTRTTFLVQETRLPKHFGKKDGDILVGVVAIVIAAETKP